MPIGHPEKATPQQIARNGHVAAFLRNELAKRGWSQSDLMEKLGITRKSTLGYPWLKATNAPTPKMAQRLAGVFGVPASTFAPAGPAPAEPAHLGALEVARPSRGTLAASGVRPLTFEVNPDGTARLRLDITLPVALAMPLLRSITDHAEIQRILLHENTVPGQE